MKNILLTICFCCTSSFASPSGELKKEYEGKLRKLEENYSKVKENQRQLYILKLKKAILLTKEKKEKSRLEDELARIESRFEETLKFDITLRVQPKGEDFYYFSSYSPTKYRGIVKYHRKGQAGKDKAFEFRFDENKAKLNNGAVIYKRGEFYILSQNGRNTTLKVQKGRAHMSH